MRPEKELYVIMRRRIAARARLDNFLKIFS